ncbi:WhiB family transcriptional regulator [Streptomyces sp. NPDC031705]|uniref:WhiB family transcriptional regulator n=1 Tax=unclassified Streptomyces TaxID=2593676 RepID=UPI0033D2C7F2
MPKPPRLRPVLEHWAWQFHAACRGVESERFFGPWNESRGDREQRDQQAKELCASCPVRQACLRHALLMGESYGVWGGLTAPERRRLQTVG